MEGMKIKRIAFEKLCNSVGSRIEIQGLTLPFVVGAITLINDHTYNWEGKMYTKNYIWIYFFADICFQPIRFSGEPICSEKRVF